MTETSQFKHLPLGRKSAHLHAFVQSVLAGVDALAREIRRRQAVSALCEFDDFALRDIGLVRSQIEAAVYGLVTPPDRTRI